MIYRRDAYTPGFGVFMARVRPASSDVEKLGETYAHGGIALTLLLSVLFLYTYIAVGITTGRRMELSATHSWYRGIPKATSLYTMGGLDHLLALRPDGSDTSYEASMCKAPLGLPRLGCMDTPRHSGRKQISPARRETTERVELLRHALFNM